MNTKGKKYLTIKEKKQLVLEGKDVPICVYPEEYKDKKRRKKTHKKLADTFSKNVF